MSQPRARKVIAVRRTAGPVLWPYGLAVWVSVLALLLTLLLDDPRTEPNTLLVFLGAVVVSSGSGGWGPGLLSTALTAVAAAYFSIPPAYSLVINSPSDVVRLIEYLAVSLLVVWLSALRRAAQRSAEAARAEAQAASAAKDVVLATVSHELRTPLHAILGSTALLRRGGLDEARVGQALARMERSVRVQLQLIEDLLDISRIVQGKLRLDICAMDLAPVIEAAVEAVRPSAEAKLIQLQLVLAPAICSIRGDPDRLQQVFWNLVTNAIKFTSREGRVEVRLVLAGSSAVISVRDTGLGISPESLPYVFERFWQAGDVTTRRPGGLGLGLAIVRELVELHGGTVEVDSHGTDQGTTFTVRLPLAAPIPLSVATA